ncbi:SCO1664 family protein [soil metagenome]
MDAGPLVADPHDLELADVLALLRTGRIEVEGRLVDASNATLFCSLTGDGVQAACVYKPVAGERPLWDFPDGTLAGREVSAYLVSEALGWEVVPPTVLRDGPVGTGMVQLWVDGDPEVDLTRLIRADPAPLRRMAVFDAVINNADRKGGHLIPMPDGRAYGVDHGVSFAAEDKLRTVLWRWAGKSLPAKTVETLRGLRTDFATCLAPQLAEHLTRREVRVTRMRLDRLLGSGCHPEPSGEWPAVPWPPF